MNVHLACYTFIILLLLRVFYEYFKHRITKSAIIYFRNDQFRFEFSFIAHETAI